MGRKVGVGTLVNLEVVMGLVFGKLLGRVEIVSSIEPPLKCVMAKRLSFRQIDGVQRSPCVTTFTICMHWLYQRGLGGIFMGDSRGVGHWISCFTRHFLIGS